MPSPQDSPGVEPQPDMRFAPSQTPPATKLRFGSTRWIVLAVLVSSLGLCALFAFLTRDAMQHLPADRRPGKNASARTGRVDQAPWQTVEAIAPLAVSSEELEYAREAERLADHSVDQAFAAALREATLQVQQANLSGEALRLSNRVQQLEQLVKQDRVAVQQLAAQEKPETSTDASDQNGGSDLDVAKAQLGLDSDELDDAQQDLARATGDVRPEIQSELAEREAAMKKYDSALKSGGETAVIASARYGTLAGRIAAWRRQNTRIGLLQQAEAEADDAVRTLTAQHNALEARAVAAEAAQTKGDRAARLKQLKTASTMRQLLSIYDDRIQSEQRLAAVYQKWAQQVRLQHRIVLHLILQSLAWVFCILIAMAVGDAVVRSVMRYPMLERRQRQTLRTILELSVQIIGILSILLMVFGAPHQTPTIVGLATAALTIALQDFVLAFFGWFVLMGKKGVRVSDIVEINGVGGEVIEIGLMSTTLLETGTLADRGYATGRRISFLNSFAIRGQYFNFSTSGQWMLDQFEVTVPASDSMATVVDAILNAAEQVTGDNARVAEQEWRRMTKGESVHQLQASPSVNLRPAGNDFGLEVRYVTRASERVETRNRLYRRVIELLHQPQGSA